MKNYIIYMILIVFSGLVFGWLLVYHPYVAQCIGMSLVVLAGIIWVGVIINTIKRGQ